MKIRYVRFIIAAITTLSAYAAYVSRVNLSIAIIAMVDDHHSALHNSLKVADMLGSSNNSSSGGGFQLEANSTTLASNFSSSDNHPPLAAHENNTIKFAKHHESVFLNTKKSVHLPLIRQEKFDWDLTEQGHILGAFFYGYILFQVPGARIAESVGAKWIIMAASAGSALISLAFPLSTQLNSIHLLMALRFVMGLCQSAFFPAAYVLFCRWLPERERSVLLPIMFIGGNIGSISTYIMSSYLISSSWGWPSVFYLSGGVCSLASLFWWIFGSSEPRDNWLITDEECRFIERNIYNQSSESSSLKAGSSGSSLDGDEERDAGQRNVRSYTAVAETDCAGKTKLQEAANCCATLNGGDRKLEAKRRKSLVDKLVAPSSQAPEVANGGGGGGDLCQQQSQRPLVTQPEPCWWKLLKSVPIWTLILSMYGNEWSQVVICYELPTYLNTALSFPIEQNGVINSFFQLSYSLASPVISSMGAYLLDRHLFGMRKIHVRKLFQSLATFGQLLCYVGVPVCGANRGLIIMLMFSATLFKACANAGDIMVPGDLSPEYAGTIFAFANSIGNTAGFFMPLLAGHLVGDPYVREQWTPFWLATGAIMGCSGLIFLVFGETRRQDLSKEPSASQPQDSQLLPADVVIADSDSDATTTANGDSHKSMTFGALTQLAKELELARAESRLASSRKAQAQKTPQLPGATKLKA